MNKPRERRFWGGYLPRLLFLFVFLLSATVTFAQKKVTGTVVDNAGEPIIGASVVISGTSKGTVTDLDGKFVLNGVPDDGSVDISYVGFVTQKLSVKGKNNLDVTMKEDNNNLDEVVVIGYGSVKKSNLTSAVSKMSDKAIADRPLARADQALQGELAGVTVRTTNGEPGADPQIRVRGAASVNASSDPLYVVDGVPMTTISNLNPSDIQSMEVLKDAASAAIYGSRGSNGVVIVTTKHGKNGKPTITFNGSVGFQTPEKKLDLMSATDWMAFNVRYHDAYYLQQAQTKGVTNASIADDSATRLANLGIAAGSSASYNYINDDRWFQYLGADVQAAHTYNHDLGGLSLLDWQDKCFRDAAIQNYDVNINGGTDKINYMVSGGYMKQDGIIVGTDYQRVNFRTNIESQINKYLSVGLNLAPTYIVTNGSGRANGKDSELHHILDSSPVSEPNVGYMTNVQPNTRYLWAKSSSSPWYVMNTNINKNHKVNVVGNAFIRLTPIEGLRLEFSGAANYTDTDGNTYTFTSTNANWASGEGSQSSGGHTTTRVWSTLLQALANYDKTFGKHGISLMAGWSREESNVGFDTDQEFSKPFPNDAITGSFNGNNITASTNTVTELTPDKLVSVFGRASYDYDNRYMVSASLRADGGSVFGTDKKWGYFPAASAGWMISSEKFWKKASIKNWWNTLKFRVSYGVTGNNNISNTAAYSTLTNATYAGAAAYYANTIANPDLSWEKTYSTDVAFDFGFLNNRIQLSLDYYTKTTKDLLYQVPVAGASGFRTTWQNLGKIDNHGFEVELNTANFTGEFKWNTSINLSWNSNEVKQLGIDNTPIHSGFNGQGDGVTASNILAVGHPVNAFYMFHATGVWKNQAEIDAYASQIGVNRLTFQGKTIKPGDIRYEDVNHDGAITLDDDRVYLGQPSPKFIFGMTNTFSWKHFDASLLITGQLGGKIMGTIGRAIDRPSMGAQTNMYKWWKNAWWSETETGDGKTPYILSTTTGGTVDSRWLYKSDFLSVKNLTIGYTVPMKSNFISRLRFYVSFENLLRFDSYDEGYSPEAANTASNAGVINPPGGAQATGLDYGGYPTARIYTFGLNITF